MPISPGWSLAHRITVPKNSLVEGWVEKTKDKDVIDVSFFRDFDAVCVDTYLGDPGAPDFRAEPGVVLAHLSRGDGGQVVIARRPVQLAVDLRIAWKPLIEEMVAGMRAQGWSGREPTRGVIFGPDPDSFLGEVEIGVPADPEASP
jgi:hypothetical protein